MVSKASEVFQYPGTKPVQLILRFVHIYTLNSRIEYGFGCLSLAVRCLSSEGTLHFRVSIDETGLALAIKVHSLWTCVICFDFLFKYYADAPLYRSEKGEKKLFR